MIDIRIKNFLTVFIISVIILFGFSGSWVVRESPLIKQQQVENTLEKLIKEYDGKYWTREYCQGLQCYAFAHYVFNNCFDRGEKQVGHFVFLQKKDPKYRFDDFASDCYISAQITPGYTKSDLEDFMGKLKPGDYLQLETIKGVTVKGFKYHFYHSLIVVGVDMENKMLEVFDANYVSANKISNRKMSFDTFYKKYDGISAYRYWKYVD